ncbi:MAG TPA: methyltransferase domain-containing protein [Thermoplasmata archaeon]|nr:methyltransferase domain-containing protein [Thermoplasmata archaeon]
MTPHSDLRSDPHAFVVRIDVGMDPKRAFDLVTEQLIDSLAARGITFHPGPDGRIFEGTQEIGRVVAWIPADHLRIEWHPAPWEPELQTEIVLRFLPTAGGTTLEWEHRGWGSVFHGSEEEIAGWFAGSVVGTLVQASAPRRLGDWLTDRTARRPEGPHARSIYRDPIYHRPNFRAILSVLGLTAKDRLIEVGCGGGAFLEEALRSGCRAAAIDHSPTMVRLAREINAEVIAEGRLTVRESEADSLPFPSRAYSCAVSTGAFAFFEHPERVLREIHRVLDRDGRFVMFTGSVALCGTTAAPEPVASRIHWYTDSELADLARAAGFQEVEVTHPDLGRWARESGVPTDALAFFEGGEGGQLLTARAGHEEGRTDA